MLSVFADFERSIIQEKGARWPCAGAQRGQTPRPASPIKDVLKQRIVGALKAPGRTEGVRKIAKRFGVNASTVQAISREIVVG